MTAIRAFAHSLRLTVIEDCAEAHGAKIGSRKVGSFGALGCFSFYANKVIQCGEGGMIVTNDGDLATRARALRNLAFGTPRFYHHEVGFNYRLSNVAASIANSQLDRIESIITAKRSLAARYNERLRGTSLQLPVQLNGYRNVYWMYCVVAPDARTRTRLIKHLTAKGIDTRTMFCPLNLQPALLRVGAVRAVACPVAESLWERGLYLPSTPTLSDTDLDFICDVVRKAL